MSDSESRLPIAVFLSGTGKTLHNLIACRDSGRLAVDFRMVVSSTKSAAGLRIASDSGIQTLTIRKSAYSDDAAYSEAMFAPCRKEGVKLVIMAGFLKHVLIPEDFSGRVINIHPSLIPSFCGEGMYGKRVHEEALRRGVKISGCTVHLVDDDYDHGPILVQRSCPVQDDDTPETLGDRVFREECIALPEAIKPFTEKYRDQTPLV